MKAEIVDRVQFKNRKTFTKHIAGCERRIYKAAYSFLHNVDDAADITQEVLLSVYKNISSFDSSKAFFPWLYRITKNKCINRVKNMNYRTGELPEFELVDKRRKGPESEVIQKEEAARIRTAVAALPENYRAIIMLRYFQDCSYAEIAEIAEIAEGTVMSRLYNARKQLKEIIEKESQYGL